MSEGKHKKSFLSQVFNVKTLGKVAFYGLSIAFSFAVMGALDFTFFHNMHEGEAFMSAFGPMAENAMRTDLFGLGSIADWLVSAADWGSTTFPNAMDAASLNAGMNAQMGAGMHNIDLGL